MGILPCKLGCALLPYTCMETVGSSVGSSILPDMKKWTAQSAVEWAAHGNFAMQIRLRTTSIYMYGDSGQLCRQLVPFHLGFARVVLAATNSFSKLALFYPRYFLDFAAYKHILILHIYFPSRPRKQYCLYVIVYKILKVYIISTDLNK